MIYLFLGENTHYAREKTKALRGAFLQKGGFASHITEVAGDNVSFEELAEIIDGNNLFGQKQLIILKHAISTHPQWMEFLSTRGEALRTAKDIFIFWERALPDDAAKEFFTTHAEKIQLLDGENGEYTLPWIRKEIKGRGLKDDKPLEQQALEQYVRGGAWAVIQLLDRVVLGDTYYRAEAAKTDNSFADKEVFRVVDMLFQRSISVGITALHDALARGAITPEDALRVLLWQIKTMAQVTRGEEGALKTFVVQKTKRLLSLFSSATVEQLWWEGILADSAMRRDKKNTCEHLERFIFSMKTPHIAHRVVDET